MAYTDKDDRHADTYAQPALLRAFPNDEKVGQGQFFYKRQEKNKICNDWQAWAAEQKRAHRK